MQTLLDQEDGLYSREDLASDLFWLNRNFGLALDQFGDHDAAIQRVDQALRVREEFPELNVGREPIQRSYEILIHWLKEAQREAEADDVRARFERLPAGSG